MASSLNPQAGDLQQQAIDWLVRLRSDSLSEAEAREFAEWLAKDYRCGEAFSAAEALFDQMVTAAEELGPERKNTHTQAPPSADPLIFPASCQSRKKPNFWWGLPSGMAAVWLLVMFGLLPEQSYWWRDWFSDYHTAIGEMRQIELPDGSKALLNTNTALSVNYSEHQRQIRLHHGQAQFSVTPDLNRPFDVRSGMLQVRALGTVFEVYRQTPHAVSVSVSEHAVAVMAAGSESVKLKAGQSLRFHEGGELGAPETVTPEQRNAWQQQRISINDRPLVELINEVNRYRLGRIYLADAKLKNLHVTGVFSLNNPDAILTRVSKALNLQIVRIGPWWILKQS